MVIGGMKSTLLLTRSEGEQSTPATRAHRNSGMRSKAVAAMRGWADA